AAGVRRLRPQPSEEPPAQEEDQDLLLAAAYVSDAQYNRNVPFETSPRAIRLYYFYNHWTMQVAIYFFICVDLSLALFEEPALFPLPFLATSIAEVLCLTAFFGRLVHFAKVTPQMVFWKDMKNICIMVTIVLTLIDLIIYGSLEAVNIHSVRWSRALRPVFLINFPESRQIRRTFRSIRNTLPDILYVFLLFMFSVLIFSLMALKLFGDRGLQTVEGLPYFTNILEIAFELYVLVTTANSPDVMMPAYNFNWWYSLYFITYIIINTYIFMSVFLAVVYNNYRKHLKNEIRKLAYLKRHKMIEAFNILKVKVGTEFVVTEARWKRLARIVMPHISSPHLELLLRISDEGQKGHVGKKPWPLPFLFAVRSKVGGSQQRFGGSHPGIRVASLSAGVTHVHSPPASPARSWPRDAAAPCAPADQGCPSQVVYYVFAIIGMEAFHGKVRFFDPNFTTPDALVCGNPALKDSAFARDRYCKNNFNDLASSLIVLMELTVVNQWHVLAGGFALVTHQVAKLYFLSFHVVVVILIVNIFIAFILEAFFVAYSLEKSEIETAIEKKIQELGVGIQEEEMQDGKLVDNMDAKDSGFSGDDGDNKRKSLKGLYFRIASKKYRTVDALLQQMFESEIAPEDEGPSLDEILNFSPGDIYPKNPNFENSA
ncbi:two pore calcium channel protein 1-like, partial [Leptonychotes weddellii]|uniref:Two pore calcium channel protein 1-like n=1 Tax=Leptonychotes weddellii TaxID=9713 RepID=A0A7F8RP08_LEPWE